MKTIYKTIFSKFVSASLIPVFFIELTLILLLFWMNNSQSQATKDSLRTISSDAFSEIAKRSGYQIEQQFMQAKHEISQLSYLASDIFSHPKRYHYPHLDIYFDQGFFRDGKKGKLSAIYTTNISKLTAKDRKQLSLLRILSPHVEHVVKANKDLIQGAWINISKYYNLFYPKIDVPNELSPDLDVTKELFYYEADKAHNPNKEIKFISLYQEAWATQFGQMGAYLSPIYAKDTFVGVIGVNVTVKKSAKTFRDIKLPFNAYAMLLDKQKRLLVSSDEKRSFNDTGVSSYYDNYLKQKSGIKSKPLKQVRLKELQENEKVIFSQDIMDTDFTIVFCADYKDIYGPADARYKETQMIGFTIIVAIALFYTLYFLFMFKSIRLIATKISQPLREMMRFSSNLGKSQDISLSKSNIVELHTLTHNFVQTHERLIQLINYDTTTNFFNQNKLRVDSQSDENQTLLFIRLENFDQYNNLYGPTVGDFAVVEMSKQIKVCTQGMGLLYRESKDTIALLTKKINRNTFVKHLDEMFLTLGKKVLLFDGVDINLSIKAGITFGRQKDGIDLLAQAHIALSEAVKNSLNTYLIYEDISAVTKQYQENLIWGKNVKEALVEDRFIAYFQPIYSYENEKFEKFESLVRMKLHGEIVSPYKFLDAAQSIGKLHEITLTMIDQVFDMAGLYPDMEFSVNTSFEDFEEAKLLDFIKHKLKSVSIDNSKIIFELLETQTFSNEIIASGMIAELKALGFKIAIDDFGTGHSNFSHMSSIDVDYIKIDGMFIKNIADEKKSEKMVKSTVSFAREIGALTIGEFVHNQVVFDKVKALGVDYAQGYYKSKPLSKEEVKSLLE